MDTQEMLFAKVLYIEGKSLTEIGKILNYSPSTIKHNLIQMNVQIRTRAQQNVISNMSRKKAVNDNYFDNINVNQAWLMGFIAADGTIRKNCNSIKLSLSSVDREILEKIKNELNIEKEVSDYETGRGFKISQLEWTSKKHKDFLAKYNIVNNKTYLPMCVPDFKDSKLILAFILGYFDGDGSISISSEKYLRFRICAHRPEILESIAQQLKKIYNLKYSLTHSDMWELSISTFYANKIFEDMYSLKSLRLERKHKKFLEYINHETTTSTINR